MHALLVGDTGLRCSYTSLQPHTHRSDHPISGSGNGAGELVVPGGREDGVGRGVAGREPSGLRAAAARRADRRRARGHARPRARAQAAAPAESCRRDPGWHLAGDVGAGPVGRLPPHHLPAVERRGAGHRLGPRPAALPPPGRPRARLPRRALAVAAAGIVPPFLVAPALVPLLTLAVPAPGHGHEPFLPLCVFVGAALSVTALPVLACILKELGLLGAPLGETAMAAAAVNDVFAWALLALALAVSGGGGGGARGAPLAPVCILASGAAFVAFMLCALRPLMARLARRAGPDRAAALASPGAVVACALLAGAATDAIGVHPVFGAFVFGLSVPREGGLAGRAGEKVAPLVSGLMLPLYFATSGLHTDIDTVCGAAAWGMVALVVAVAFLGKFGGTFAVAAWTGMARREAAALGVAMSAKGLVELIVLNIGKERKVCHKYLLVWQLALSHERAFA
ncbi:cation/H(+) antiporter 20-like [Panicum miliaceum]|uniref:Cation/H(+) antiporter 20-like n=1 Tax=Panicum miliaceum TaxID=4540 RepID=A0A3L6SVM7_PANMI|nr:cation/H(+) antiporter 20-like [Panicum miliaceum]